MRYLSITALLLALAGCGGMQLASWDRCAEAAYLCDGTDADAAPAAESAPAAAAPSAPSGPGPGDDNGEGNNCATR